MGRLVPLRNTDDLGGLWNVPRHSGIIRHTSRRQVLHRSDFGVVRRHSGHGGREADGRENGEERELHFPFVEEGLSGFV